MEQNAANDGVALHQPDVGQQVGIMMTREWFDGMVSEFAQVTGDFDQARRIAREAVVKSLLQNAGIQHVADFMAELDRIYGAEIRVLQDDKQALNAKVEGLRADVGDFVAEIEDLRSEKQTLEHLNQKIRNENERIVTQKEEQLRQKQERIDGLLNGARILHKTVADLEIKVGTHEKNELIRASKKELETDKKTLYEKRASPQPDPYSRKRARYLDPDVWGAEPYWT
ncbi:uncharacterized protein PG986_013016 [Apiospora aurea]|uniref:Uncharacterized protein n=1 Tax=Apiospora aurea TaxID=335848 RepID=A0ABR1Q1N4_9PEZI